MEAGDYAADDVLRDGAPVRIRFDNLPGSEQAPLRAELGIVVEDAQQNRGIVTVPLKHLLGLAHARGVAQIVAEAGIRAACSVSSRRLGSIVSG